MLGSNRSSDKYDQLYNEFKKTGNKEYRDKLLQSLTPTVTAAIRSYGRDNYKLRTRAFILANKAIDTYKPNPMTGIRTYVHSSLRKLARYAHKRDNVVHIPEGVRLDNWKVKQFHNKFKEEHDREPDLIELSDGTGLPVRRITKLQKQAPEYSMSHTISAETGDNLHNAEITDEDNIWKDYIYHDMAPRDRKIFEWTTGYKGSPILPKKEIASKLKISAPAVSQRINKIMTNMSKGLAKHK